jgi:sigma-B regulation protein RsbU (phosphoserine phosphatase)
MCVSRSRHRDETASRGPERIGTENPNVENPEFAFISDLCHVLAEQTELQPILDWLVKKSTQMLGSDECSIKLVRAEAVSPYTVVTKPRFPESGTQSWPTMLKESVIGFLHRHGELATPDIENDPRFPSLGGLRLTVRALAAVTLKVDGHVTGMLAASNRTPGRKWSKHDLQLLSIIATHSAGVIEKARLRVEAEKAIRLELEHQAMEKELSVARELQMRLVPAAPLQIGHWQVEGRLSPAREVGGDFYDYFELDRDRVALVIADVTGQGHPRGAAGVHGPERAPGVRRGRHRAVAGDRAAQSHGGAFLRGQQVRDPVLCRAGPRARKHPLRQRGHNHPRLRRADRTLELLETGGLALGMFESGAYQMRETAFGPEDSLLLVTDGIPDAQDAFERFFDEWRHDALWREHGGEPAGVLLDRLMAAVKAHRGSTPQADDETAMVVAPRRG